MSKNNTFENDILLLIFNGTTIANIADNAASAALTQLFVSLHTAVLAETDVQTANEAAYTGYARIAVNRNSGGWTVASGSVTPTADIVFGACTASAGAQITHASIGVAISGGSKVLYTGTLNPAITMAVGVIPTIKATTSTITED
jgi:hypothetical protein